MSPAKGIGELVGTAASPGPGSARRLVACLAVGLLFLLPSSGGARDYFVSPAGNDTNPGTFAQPFRTLARAVAGLVPGDTCYLRSGTYRERVRLTQSGEPGLPVRIAAWQNEEVVLSGTSPVEARWRRFRRGILQTRFDAPISQLFVKGRGMIEARWPNVTARTRWDRSTWARARQGSRYGEIVDPSLAKTGIDWTGATAILNVAHQFSTWSRPVISHGTGSTTFTYPRDLTGIADYAGRTTPWEDDYYILFGALEALDAPGEWFQEGKRLYFMPPKGINLNETPVEAKVRELAIHGRGLKYVEVRGLTFFATTLRFEECFRCLVENNRFLYPVYNRDLSAKGTVKFTQVSGDDNIVRRNILRYSGLGGFLSVGDGNRIEQNIIHDVGMFGGIDHAGIEIVGRAPGKAVGSTVSRNTVFNGGNTLIRFKGGPHVIEGNHVYDGGLLSKDVSLIYTAEPTTRGSVVRRNWVHGCRSEDGGIGIRGDDQTRGLQVDHNVVWDCSAIGIVAKGDGNRIFNNTVFDISGGPQAGIGILLPDGPEPPKPWREQNSLLPRQNRRSAVRNNAATSLAADEHGNSLPFHPGVSSNYTGRGMGLRNPAAYDFRPAGYSPLVDAGEPIKGVTDDVRGRAPDIGAYESGRRPWIPGASRRK